ncbi:MAG: hypothetical protein ABJF10_07365 [Chthoniobacter sp.]|uniref:hypothetical protein n=1 Tax=Chthoniobacter sp. TaxID=2510640 RepID=UPI0032A1D5C9
MLLVNGYLIMEPLLGKTQAVKLTLQTAKTLVGHVHRAPTETEPAAKASGIGRKTVRRPKSNRTRGRGQRRNGTQRTADSKGGK